MPVCRRGPILAWSPSRYPLFPRAAAQIRVRLNINPIIVGPAFLSGPGSFTITSDSGAVPITASSSDSWLSVTPASTTTPAHLAVSISVLTAPRLGFPFLELLPAAAVTAMMCKSGVKAR
jgi:hypothetical protein